MADRNTFKADPSCPYNQLPHFVGYNFRDDDVLKRQQRTNLTTYERLKEVVVFADKPVPGKVTLRHDGVRYGHFRVRILSNPIRLDNDLIALFADHGNLCFGYGIEKATISIYTD